VGSTRLPNKVFRDLAGKPLIWHVVDRIKRSRRISGIILATSTSPSDDLLQKWAEENGVALFRGSEEDVLSRFYGAAKKYGAEAIARITADDPFKDPAILDKVIEAFIREKLDFCYNNNPPTFPEGLDCEVFTFNALSRAHQEAKDPFEREHVTPYLYRHPEIFRQKNLPYSEDLSFLRWTLDTKEDYDMASAVYRELYRPGRIFLMENILALLKRKPEIARMNAGVKRSAMYLGKRP
jgi:spore coat polysaccharide biosynthesis protein SpsF